MDRASFSVGRQDPNADRAGSYRTHSPQMVPVCPGFQIAGPNPMGVAPVFVDPRQRIVERYIKQDGTDKHAQEVDHSRYQRHDRARFFPAKESDHDEQDRDHG